MVKGSSDQIFVVLQITCTCLSRGLCSLSAWNIMTVDVCF